LAGALATFATMLKVDHSVGRVGLDWAESAPRETLQVGTVADEGESKSVGEASKKTGY
jgi:hypothetical protein